MNGLKGPKVAIIWTILRIWLGVQWLESGIHKITGGFDATGFLQGAVAKSTGDHPAVQGWYAAFLENVAIPNVGAFNILIPYGELFVGIGLILGFMTIPALLAGAFMNLNFMLAGTTSTNPVLYTVAILLMFAGTAAYFYGVDRMVLPILRDKWNYRHHQKEIHAH
ncbi:DoxX family protein [Bacillus sp. FJAT-47783]|uniref:DoxX family protein n=1 Tax=Bacillus sp. FJAT-47783 TaxID=2922712 RepID=UPI001FABEAF5|nr:DoxX family protein [Bacillus sp. FJAT-47783]